jgi:hypothetical protein
MDQFARAFEELAEWANAASPSDILAAIAEELRRRREHPRYDMTKIALQAWAESARSLAVHRAIRDGQERLGAILRALVQRWAATTARTADLEQTSGLLQTLVPGLMLATVLTGHTPAPTLPDSPRGEPAGWSGFSGA